MNDEDPEAIDPTGGLDELLIFGSPETRRRFLKRVGGTGAAITIGPSLMGFGAVPVAAGSATILYEVVARSPYSGVNGCAVLDAFNLTVQPWPAGSLAGANVVGSFAPLDPTARLDSTSSLADGEPPAQDPVV